MNAARFRRFGVFVLGFTVAVILWGAFVRASGAGAGCGSHWPSCNGQVIPRSPKAATIIEFTHRVTSGLSLVLVLAQLVLAFRVFPRRHAVRRAAVASMAFLLTEALVGAGLVLFEMVAQNRSLVRGLWTMAHLLNTFALVASLALVVWAARPRPASTSPLARVPRGFLVALAIGLGATLLVAMTGAIAALGDTLFPARSLAEGWQQDLAATSHLFVRIRIAHPMLAIATGLYLLVTTGLLASRDAAGTRSLATGLALLVLGQLGAGLLNLVLLAPVWMQLVHLLLADLVWIGLVWLTAGVAWSRRATAAVTPPQPASSRSTSLA